MQESGVPLLVGDLSLAGLQFGGKAPLGGGSALESQRHDGQADQGDTNDEDPEQDLGPLVDGGTGAGGPDHQPYPLG